MSTIEIIMELIDKSNITVNAFEKSIGLTRGSVYNWNKGLNKPSTEALVKIAEYFNISVDFLLGRGPKLPSLKLGKEKNDLAPWYSAKLHESLVSLAKIADYLLEIKKNSINDEGLKYIQQELSISLDYTIRLIAMTNGADDKYDGDEYHLIIEKGIEGYKETMEKLGIVPYLLNKMYSQKRRS